MQGAAQKRAIVRTLLSGTCTLKVRVVFVQGWRLPGRRRAQKVIRFVVYFKAHIFIICKYSV
jgi:hypothetical protein